MRLIRKLAMAIILVSLLAMLFPLSVAQADDAVNFPDPNLQAAIREAIGKPMGDIYQSDLVGLTTLNAPLRFITDLTGLQRCTSLNTLYLYFNQISDISPLAELTNLRDLSLRHNQISDISPLAELTNLRDLSLTHNQISDISPLAGLTNLRALYVDDNQISDISPLAGLTNLWYLGLSNNQISDISTVAGLTAVWYLELGGNQISDTSPLAGLTNLVDLFLGGNQISDISPLAGLTKLTDLGLWDNQISDITPVAGLTNITWLRLYNNLISDITPVAGLTKLWYLELYGNQISDISPVAGLTNLINLFLDGNQISDISPVAGLTNLAWLRLNNNQISDIEPLVNNQGLGQGDTVDLRSNPLSDTSIHTYIPQLQARGVTVDYDAPSNRAPNQPTNASPTDGATGISNSPTLQSSAFSDPDASDTHAASEWQVTMTSGDYSSPAFQSLIDSTNLTTWSPGAFGPGDTYYWHVRHLDNHGAWSDWSVETSFTTMAMVPTPTPTPTPTPAPISCTQFSSHPGNSAQVSISGASVSQSTATYGDTVNIHVEMQYVGPVTPILGFPTLMIHKPNGTVLAEWNMDEQGGINPGFPAFPVPFCISQGNIFVFDVSWDLKDIYGYWVPPAQYNIQAGIMIPEQNNPQSYWILSSIGGAQPGPISVIGTQLPNTLAGQNVTVPFYVQSTPPHPMAVVTFSEVTGDGTTAIELSGANPVGPTPSGFYPVGPFVRITTTAYYTGSVTVGIGLPPPPVPPVSMPPVPPDMKMFHWDGTSWKDVTTNVDAVNRIVYGQDESLDWWFVGYTMATVPTATRTGIVGFSSSSGTIESLTAISESSLPAEGKPSLLFPNGLFSFDITGLSSGETVEVTIELPSNVPTNAQYWKWDSTLGWYQIDFGDNDGDNIITIQLTDNGTGDSDPTPGRIHDDGGPAYPPSGGGGALGVPVFPSVYIGIAAALGAGVLAYFLRRRLVQQG